MLGGTTAQEADIFVVAEELLTVGTVVPGVTSQVSDIVTKVRFIYWGKDYVLNFPFRWRSPAQQAPLRQIVPMRVFRHGDISTKVPHTPPEPTFFSFREINVVLVPPAVFPDISQRSDLRAYHASELPLVFGTYNASTAAAGPTGPEIALSQLVQTAWVSFARDPVNGLKNAPFSWPQVNGGNKVVLLGNSANPGGATFTSSSTIDGDCGSIDVLVALYNLLGIDITL